MFMMVGLWQCGNEELLAEITANEQDRRALDSRTLAILGEAQNRGLAASKGYASSAVFLTHLLRISRAKANRRLASAREVAGSPGISGASVPAPLPGMGAALAEGAVTAEHVAAVEKFRASLPGGVTAAEWEPAEKVLADLARQVGPAELRRFAERQVRPRLDPDGTLPDETEQSEPKRRLDWHRRDDGTGTGRFDLDTEAAEQLDTLLSALSTPRPDATGAPDPRGLESRRGDALAEIIDLAAGNADRPAEGGDKPQLVVTTTLEELGCGRAALLGGNYLPLPIESARRIGCDCQVIPAVLGAKGEVLDIGRASRSIPPAIRRAVTLRDRGCAFPGCGRPPAWCHAHHIHHWSDGGETKLANLVMLCPSHHRILHHTAWQVRIAEDELPEFIPPDWLDPSREPRRNPLHQQE
jgi:hypothetical protein